MKKNIKLILGLVIISFTLSFTKVSAYIDFQNTDNFQDGPIFKEQSITMNIGETINLEIINDDTDNLYLSYSNPIDYGNILSINGSKITALKKGIAVVTLKSGYKTYDTIYIYVDAEEYIEEQMNNLNAGIVIGALETPDTDYLKSYVSSYLNNLFPASIMNLNESTLSCSSTTNCNIDLIVTYNEKTYTHQGNTNITLTNSYISLAADTIMLSIGSNVAPYFNVVKNGQDVSESLICTSSNEDIVYVQDNSCYNIIGREEGTAEVSFIYEGQKYTFNVIVGYNMGLLDKAAGILTKTKYNFLTSDITNGNTEFIKKQLEKTLADNGISEIKIQSVTKKNNDSYQATLYYYWDKSTKNIDLDISINDLKVKENIIEISTNQTKQIEFNVLSTGTTFKVENSKVISVSSNGLITALSPGKTKIYVTNSFANYSDVIEVYVDYETYLKNNIKKNYEVNSIFDISIYISENLKEVLDDTIFTYDIVSVEGKEDTKTIKINYVTKDQHYLEINNVKMKIEYNFNSTDIKIKVGETFQVKFSGAYKEWYVNNPQIVSVKDGFVTGLKDGTTEIGLIDQLGNKHPIKVTVGEVISTLNGLRYNETTKRWEYYINGKFANTYNGIATNENGTWILDNGIITFKHNELFLSNNKWYLFENSKHQDTYNGLSTNANGTWYIKNGFVDFSYNGTYKDSKGTTYTIKNGKVENQTQELKFINGKWYMVENGQVNKSYTGIGTNQYGTWYLDHGTITFSNNGLILCNNKWYLFENSKHKDSYTGLSTNANGTWYVKNGIIDFSYTGTYKDLKGDNYIIKNGEMQKKLTEVMMIDGKWRMVEQGKVNYTYTGIGKNGNGTWYLENGLITFKNTGLVLYQNKWYLLENSKLKDTYTGLSTNANGTWYVKNGIIDFSYTGIYKDSKGVTYTIKNGKVV